MLTRPALAGGRLHPVAQGGGHLVEPRGREPGDGPGDGPRAFRIGQHRNVLVHKFVTSGTIEEKIELMLAEKRQLADELIDGDGEVGITELPDDELLDLVRLDVTRAAP